MNKLPTSIHAHLLNYVHSNYLLWAVPLCPYILHLHHSWIYLPLWILRFCSATNRPQSLQPPISDGGYTILLVTSHHISHYIHTSSTLHHHYWRSCAFTLILCNKTRGWRNTFGRIISTTTCTPQKQSGKEITSRHVLGGYVICCLESKV